MTATASKPSVNYRIATFGWLLGKRCGTCTMFRPRTCTCTLVKGRITPGAVCDRWAAK